jgi:hypothetical protein
MKISLASAAWDRGAPRFGPEGPAYVNKTSGGFSNDFRHNIGSGYPLVLEFKKLNFLQNSVAVHRWVAFNTKSEWKIPGMANEAVAVAKWFHHASLIFKEYVVLTSKAYAAILPVQVPAPNF